MLFVYLFDTAVQYGHFAKRPAFRTAAQLRIAQAIPKYDCTHLVTTFCKAMLLAHLFGTAMQCGLFAVQILPSEVLHHPRSPDAWVEHPLPHHASPGLDRCDI